MATLTLEVEPLEVPTTVTVRVGSEVVEVSISELDETTITSLLEDFTDSLLQQVAR